MGRDVENYDKKSSGMYCSRKRLVLVSLLTIVLFVGSILITHFVTKDNIEGGDNAGDNWPDPWGDKEPVTYDEWRSGFLSYYGYSVSWINGENAYYRSVNGNLNKYSAPNFDTAETLVPQSVFTEADSSSYYFSPDLRYMLFVLNRQSKWRYSFDATYKIYDRTTQNWYDFPGDASFKDKPLELARWTDGSNYSLAFVYQNTLYYQANPESTTVTQVQAGDVDQNIFAGHSDWVYEEELLYTNKAFWGSGDGKYLVYGVFDESHLPVQEYSWYGEDLDVYGDTVHIAYPKPALNDTQKTSRIQMRVWDTATKTAYDISPPSEFLSPDREHYVTDVSWRDDTHVVIVWTDRLQDKAIYTFCDVTDRTCVRNYVYAEPNGWVDPASSPLFMNNKQEFVTIFPKSETSGNWRHIALQNSPVTGGEQTPNFLTQGEKEASGVVAVDQDRHLVYYYAFVNNGNDRHLYRVGTPSADASLQADTCITCNMGCDYVTASFASTTDYYLLTCSGKDVPWYKLINVDNDQHTTVRVMQDNAAYKEKIKKKAMPTQDWIRAPVGGGHTAEVMLWLPPNYNDGNKHPLFVHVYAGPGSQYVTSRWTTGWQTYLASMEGVVYARIDGRGSQARGDTNRFRLDRSLGTVEVEDQIHAVKWMIENMNIDEERVALWGSSYGGFVTLHALADSKGTMDAFKCGISQSPVTDFRYYDAAYTERFMDKASPSDNQAGYEKTNMLAKVKDLENKKLLLSHGTADDNVHYLHAAHLIKALNRENIQYRTLVRPDSNHYTMGSAHTYRMYTDFLIEDCFGHKIKDKEYVPPS